MILQLNANLSMWKLVGELAMVCALSGIHFRESSANLGLKEAHLLCLSPIMVAGLYNSAESQDVKQGPCTSGTRGQELAELRGWVRDGLTGDVYWMNGVAGTGKPTIAYGLCDDPEKTERLAATFFCSRPIPECRKVKLILPVIADQLARCSRPFRYALSQVLEAEPILYTRALKST